MIRLDRNGQVDFRDIGILVVDDEQFSRAIIRQSLLNLGCGRVDVAENGAQALELMLNAGQSYDAVISDIRMPTMDGLELLRRVRCGARGVPRDLVFGILTGFSDKEVIGLAFNLDVDFFIAKPPTIDGLKTRLSKAMTTSRPIKAMKEYGAAARPAAPAPKAERPAPDMDSAADDPAAPEPKAGIVLKAGRPAPTPAAPEEPGAAPATAKLPAKAKSAKSPMPAARAVPSGTVVTRKLSEVVPGAVLADDLRTSGGTLILQCGFTLTPQLIERLRNLAEVDPDVAQLRVVLPDRE